MDGDQAIIDTLRLRIDQLEEMIEHLRSWLPREGCGLLATDLPIGGVATASRFFPGTNIDDSQVRFTMEPAEVIAAFREMRKRNLYPCAIVHSHPDSNPVPSATDFAEDYYPDMVKMIVSFRSENPEIRVWKLASDDGDDRYQEVALEVVPKVTDTGSTE